MPTALNFDTLAFAKKLKSSGFTEQQAETLAEAQAELIYERLATKSDIMELKRDIKEMESTLTIRLGKMLAWTTSLTVVILGVLIKLL
jgi:hypothetical protein